MSKDDDKTTEKTDQKPADPGMSKSVPFTIKIINHDGKHYYKLESHQLGPERDITDADMLDMVKRGIRLVHHPKEPAAFFSGTFIVNLSALKE
jgi:hypothetical protein